MATGSFDCSVKLIDLTSKTVFATFQRTHGITRPVKGIAFSPNNKYVVAQD